MLKVLIFSLFTITIIWKNNGNIEASILPVDEEKIEFKEDFQREQIATIINDNDHDDAFFSLSKTDNDDEDNSGDVEQIDNGQRVRYDGAQLWRIKNDNDYVKNAVAELETKYDGKIWAGVEESYDILIKSPSIENAEELLEKSNISHVVLIEDLQNAIESENPPKEEIEMLQNRQGHKMTWRAYHRVSDIHGYLGYLEQNYPNLCSVETIGYSVQKRPLKVLRISNRNPSNKAIWIDGGIHAREWISPASVTYVIDQIVEKWDELPDYMRNIDWYILPVVNPDGYEYSHKVDRLWRKNRGRSPSSGQCTGIDLNRNFGYKWGGQGTSKNPCAEIYPGSRSFSEPETVAIKNFLSKYGGQRFKGYLTFHSYGQYILYPWGFNKSVPADHKELDRVAKEAAANMVRLKGAKYQVGPSGSLLYPAAGGSDDWAKGQLGIKYAYTIEMGDTGRYGFVLPSNYIKNGGIEAYSFVSTVAKAISQS